MQHLTNRSFTPCHLTRRNQQGARESGVSPDPKFFSTTLGALDLIVSSFYRGLPFYSITQSTWTLLHKTTFGSCIQHNLGRQKWPVRCGPGHTVSKIARKQVTCIERGGIAEHLVTFVGVRL